MSSLIVDVCEIKEIKPHDNSDFMELAIVKGWQCCVKKGDYKQGQDIIYIPPDAILPIELAEKLGVRNYLVGKNNDRVKCIKLRGEMSYGLIIKNSFNWDVGRDVSEIYGILKYEPPIRAMMGDASPEDPLFPRMSDIENIRNFPDTFKNGELVAVTEKIDGCFRKDQKVLLADGSYTPISNVRFGTKILAFDEKQQELIQVKVTESIVRYKGKKWIQLNFNNNKEIVCTRDHLFLTKNDGWIEAKELNIDDDIMGVNDGNITMIKLISKQLLSDKFHCYDLSVRKIHSFIVDGVIVHNSQSRLGLDKEGVWKAGSRKVKRKRPDDKELDTNIYWYPYTIQSIRNMLEHLVAQGNDFVQLYGEVYGRVRGGLKSMHYGIPGNFGYVAFRLKINGKWIPYKEFSELCDKFDVEKVPLLNAIPFNFDEIKKYSQGDSILAGKNKSQHLREGVVVVSYDNVDGEILKFINDDYLLLKQKRESKGEVVDYTDV